jgi:hypothetical protein
MWQKEGVDTVHTLGVGPGRTGAGLGRIPHVSGGAQCLQGLEYGSSPTSDAVRDRCLAPRWPIRLCGWRVQGPGWRALRVLGGGVTEASSWVVPVAVVGLSLIHGAGLWCRHDLTKISSRFFCLRWLPFVLGQSFGGGLSGQSWCGHCPDLCTRAVVGLPPPARDHEAADPEGERMTKTRR